MIKVNVTKKNNNISKIILEGHALYDDFGKDIVCAAVSSTVITTVNGILKIKDTINYEVKKDKLIINVLEVDEITNKLLDNLLDNLKQLETDYKENIRIKEE